MKGERWVDEARLGSAVGLLVVCGWWFSAAGRPEGATAAGGSKAPERRPPSLFLCFSVSKGFLLFYFQYVANRQTIKLAAGNDKIGRR